MNSHTSLSSHDKMALAKILSTKVHSIGLEDWKNVSLRQLQKEANSKRLERILLLALEIQSIFQLGKKEKVDNIYWVNNSSLSRRSYNTKYGIDVRNKKTREAPYPYFQKVGSYDIFDALQILEAFSSMEEPNRPKIKYSNFHLTHIPNTIIQVTLTCLDPHEAHINAALLHLKNN